MLKLKQFVPRPFKQLVKQRLQEYTFRKAMKELLSLPLGHMPSRNMIDELQRGWANDGFAGRTDYLSEVALWALRSTGPILECGSGLSTIILGALAGRNGIEIWSLEHIPEWRDRVQQPIEKYHLSNTHVCQAPLRSYGEFSWYEPKLGELPSCFHLVICDGPPGTTAGNRYGLLPIIGSRIGKGTTILLDDSDRPGEAEVVRRWCSERNFSVEQRATPTGTFAILTLNQ
jgi:hypothetical protein